MTPASNATPWWCEAIIYQVYPRSFLDTNGDGVGDLAGITAKLDYIAALGVDIVWISPFFKSPMKDFGYDVSDYCDVDPLFGTLADFDRLIARPQPGPEDHDRPGDVAHGRGPSLVRREPRQPRQSQGRLVCLGRSPGGRQSAEQLAVDLRRLGLAVGQPSPPVLYAQFPGQPAGHELPQPASAAGASGQPALLAGARRRRRAHGRLQLPFPRPFAVQQSAGGQPRQHHRYRRQSVWHAGPRPRQEPAGKPGLPAKDPHAAQ